MTWMSTVQVNNYVYNVQQVDVTMAMVVDDGGSGTAPPKTVSLVAIVMASLLGSLWHL